MNIYLQSFKKHDTILELQNTEILRSGEKLIPTSGWYLYIENTLCYLLFNENKVFLSFGTQIFEINENSHASLFGNFFELYQKNNLVLKFAYPKASENLDYDISGFTEEEDFDWGLFLKNIINNPSRINIIFEEKNKVS